MNLQRRDLLLLMTLAATAAAPAWGQTAAPPAGPAHSAAQVAASIPDFSGIWAHPGLGFENPVSGPGPVRNLQRTPSGASNFNLLVGDYRNPILKPHAAEIVKKFGEISLSGRAFPDPDSQCLLNPVPYIFWNFEIQLLQQPDKVTIINPHDQDYRQIRLNQPHPAKVIPTAHGDSVGHYEGDTLVVDTEGIKVGRYTMVDRFGTPYTEALHVVEPTGCSPMKPPRKRKNGPRKSGRLSEPMGLIPTTGARGCNSNSLSRMKASSRCLGRRPLRICAPGMKTGRNVLVPKI